MALSGQVDKGRLTALRALRDLLAVEIDDCESKRDSAALSRVLLDVLEQVEAAEKALPAAKGTALDEFTRRRSEREAPGAPLPKVSRKRG